MLKHEKVAQHGGNKLRLSLSDFVLVLIPCKVMIQIHDKLSYPVQTISLRQNYHVTPIRSATTSRPVLKCNE